MRGPVQLVVISAALLVAACVAGPSVSPLAPSPSTPSTPATTPTLTPRSTPLQQTTPSPTLPPGWTLETGNDFAIGLPLGWQPKAPSSDEVFAASSPAEGTLFILFDDRSITNDFNAYLRDHATEEQRVSGNAPTLENVTLPAGPAIRDRSQLFGIGVQLGYLFPSKGRGVGILSFTTIDATDEPDVWAEVARTFNPYAAALP